MYFSISARWSLGKSVMEDLRARARRDNTACKVNSCDTTEKDIYVCVCVCVCVEAALVARAYSNGQDSGDYNTLTRQVCNGLPMVSVVTVRVQVCN